MNRLTLNETVKLTNKWKKRSTVLVLLVSYLTVLEFPARR